MSAPILKLRCRLFCNPVGQPKPNWTCSMDSAGVQPALWIAMPSYQWSRHASSSIACAMSRSVLIGDQWSARMAVDPAINDMQTDNADSIVRKGTFQNSCAAC